MSEADGFDPSSAFGKGVRGDPDIDYQTIVKTLPVAVYTTDMVGRLSSYNDAAAGLWGCRPKLGRSVFCGAWKLYWPDGTPVPHAESPVALTLKEGRPVRDMEMVAERPDGSRIAFLPYPTLLRDTSGAVTGTVNMLVDLTERRRSQALVSASEARYRGMFENARVALWDDDYGAVMDLLDELRAQGVDDLRAYLDARPDRLAEAVGRVRLRDVNAFSVELFEAERKDVLLGARKDTFLAETDPTFVEELVALWEGRRRFESETTLRTLKGRRLDVIYTMAFEGERCERTLVSILDISARKAAERALLERTHHLATLNRIAKVVASDLDLDHVVQTVTDTATKLSGAQFGAFFYDVVDEQGESHRLHAVCGAPREAFDEVDSPRNTALFAPTFRGTGAVRSDDIRVDPRFARVRSDADMAEGGLPVASYLAVPIISSSGKVHGGLFLGHERPDVFTSETEDIVDGIAAHAAIAIDNAHLYRAAQAEIQQRRRAEQVERQLAAIVESCNDAIVSKNLEGIISSWNGGAEQLFGYSAQEVIGKPIMILIPQDRRDEEYDILARIRRGERLAHFETIRRRKDGTLVEVSITVSPVRDGEGTIVGASKVARDITERRRVEELKELLLREMKHRIKNNLATVQALATQTLQSAPKEERASFIARLHALAGAHELLTYQEWDRARVGQIVRRALVPFEERHRQGIVIEGPDTVSLDANKSVLLSMAIHELATNAIKYGALSNGRGGVRVTWELLADDRLTLRWQERGGPPVRPSERRGFGSRLIERALGGEMGASRFEFAVEGVTCTLEIPI